MLGHRRGPPASGRGPRAVITATAWERLCGRSRSLPSAGRPADRSRPQSMRRMAIGSTRMARRAGT